MYRKHLEGPFSRMADIAEQSREGEAAFFFFLFLVFGTNIFLSANRVCVRFKVRVSFK